MTGNGSDKNGSGEVKGEGWGIRIVMVIVVDFVRWRIMRAKRMVVGR